MKDDRLDRLAERYRLGEWSHWSDDPEPSGKKWAEMSSFEKRGFIWGVTEVLRDLGFVTGAGEVYVPELGTVRIAVEALTAQCLVRRLRGEWDAQMGRGIYGSSLPVENALAALESALSSPPAVASTVSGVTTPDGPRAGYTRTNRVYFGEKSEPSAPNPAVVRPWRLPSGNLQCATCEWQYAKVSITACQNSRCPQYQQSWGAPYDLPGGEEVEG